MAGVLGVRAVAFVARHLVWFVVLGGIGGMTGWALGNHRAQVYGTHALIEIGMRPPNEWLEPPVVAAERLAGHLTAMARRFDRSAATSVNIRRDKNHALTRFLDVVAEARTASAAQAILDGAVAALIDEHRTTYAYERELVQQEVEHAQRAAERIKTAIARGGEDADVLGAELYETHKVINDRSAALSPFRMPETHVVAKDGSAATIGSKTGPTAISGLLLGLIAAVVLLGIKAVRAPPAAAPSIEVDPIIRGFLDITARYKTWIWVTMTIGTAIGFAVGMSRPTFFRARGVVQCGTTADQTLENLELIAPTLEQSVPLPPNTGMRVTPLVGPPPSPEETFLLEMFATGPSSQGAEDAVAAVGNRVVAVEAPLFAAEHRRIEAHVKALEEDLSRCESEKLTAESHEMSLRLYRELEDARRLLSPARAHPPKVLGIHTAEELPRSEATASLALFGLILGLAAGYLVAFVAAAGARAPKSA